jgi:hypothetical protein
MIFIQNKKSSLLSTNNEFNKEVELMNLID